MTTKRLLLAGLALLLVVLVVVLIAPPGGSRYLANAMVVVEPYTNVFLAHSFESHMIRTIPGVVGLQVTPAFSAIPGSGVPVLTNGVAIRIIAAGSTPQDAQRAANDAAVQICKSVSTNYAAKGEFVERATTARSYSYFHDSLQPGVVRLFKH